MTIRRATGRLSLLVGALSLACSAPFTDARTGDLPQLDFDLLFADDANGRIPTSLEWSPLGNRLAFFFKDDDGKGLWLLDPQEGNPELLGRAEDDQEEINAFHWAPDGGALLLESENSLSLIDLATRKTRVLTDTDASREDPKFSPDGRSVAFVRDNDLWTLDVAGRGERQLTLDGEDGVTLNGKTDWVYWEEIWGRTANGYWWSPDGRKIAYYQFDETPVREYPLVDFTQQYPEVTWQKYPKAGEANPIVRVGVLDLQTGTTEWLVSNATDDSYLARVDWLPSGDRLAIQRLNREQNDLELLLCETQGGRCTTLLHETSDTWVNLTKDLQFLPDGRFLWTTEDSGWRNLWLHSADGERLRELTPPNWTTDRVDGLVAPTSDVDGAHVVWTGFEMTPLGARHRTVFAQSVPAGEPVALSSDDVTAQASVSSVSGLVALTESRADMPAVAKVVDLTGERVAELPTTGPSGFDPAALPSWRFLTIPGPAGSRLPAALLEPANPIPGRRYPVIQYHYGCPASQVVRDSWGGSRNLWHKLMAARGYGVLLVDNGSSNFFGKVGAERAHRRFGAGNAAAQKAAVEFLDSLEWADTSRIGLWGWSGGGSNTLYAILDSPGTWRAAVAGAPVTDWRLYDSIWTERYLDHPSDNAKGYDESSPVTYAANLDDALLLVHGTADDNVHPQNTLAMAAKLVEAGKPFELAIHPRQKHSFRSKDSRHFYERMTGFFDQELAPETLGR